MTPQQLLGKARMPRRPGVLPAVLAAVLFLAVVVPLWMTRTMQARVQVQPCIHPPLHPALHALLLVPVVALLARRAVLVAVVSSCRRPKVTVQQPQTALQMLVLPRHPVPQPRCITIMAITTAILSVPTAVTRRRTKLVRIRPRRSLWRQLRHPRKP